MTEMTLTSVDGTNSLDASVIDHLVDEMETALDAGDPDRALELFLPATRGHSRPRGVGP
jgi:hypothetical protein